MNADQAGVYSALIALDDEDIVTDLDQSPFSPVPAASETRESFFTALRGSEPQKPPVLREQETLASTIARLEQTCAAFDAIDVSGAAAELSLRRRVGSLAVLASALGNVCAFVLSTEHHELFAQGALLEPYLSNVHMWTGDVTETLEHLARELNELAPNWSAFRECLSNVEWIYDRAASEQERLDRVKGELPVDVRDALGELFAALSHFKHALAEPFG